VRHSGRAGSGGAGPSGPAREQEIIEGLKPVCLCKGVRTSTVLRLIRSGKLTVEDVQQATGAGSGSCGGKRCTPRIEELIRRSEKKRTGGR
jgi:NAD(P)H-nitrite reductase large subunit